jgi:hypothetical protein
MLYEMAVKPVVVWVDSFTRCFMLWEMAVEPVVDGLIYSVLVDMI